MSSYSDQDLITAAIAASQNAYIPYSHYAVGAALLASDGRLYTGLQCGERILHADNMRGTHGSGQSRQRRRARVCRRGRGHARRRLALRGLPPAAL